MKAFINGVIYFMACLICASGLFFSGVVVGIALHAEAALQIQLENDVFNMEKTYENTI